MSTHNAPNYKPSRAEYLLIIFSFREKLNTLLHTEAITGHSITDKEDTQAVWGVLEQHTRRYGDPLALLLDNDKANYKIVAEKLEGVIPIFAFKGCPETKAVLDSNSR